MISKRTALMSAATLCSALAIGLVMQHTAGSPQTSVAAPVAELAVVAETAPPDLSADVPLQIDAISLTAATPEAGDGDAQQVLRQKPEPSCEMTAEAVPGPMAEVRLTVLSLCRPGERHVRRTDRRKGLC